MTETAIIPVKYVFLDVVGFTHDRSVETQSDIVRALNEIVKASVDESSIPDNNKIFIPTGDGICIALLNIDCLEKIETPYDLHLRIALSILRRLDEYNNADKDEELKFKIRIGINENVDNVVIDINGNRNVAGDGINMAQRVMSLADGNQILVSPSVFTTLGIREKYFKTSFKAMPRTKIKHGIELSVHQFIASNHAGLNVDTPQRFKTPERIEPLLTELAAHYFAHAIKNEKFFLAKADSGLAEIAGIGLLYLLATDSVEMSHSKTIDAFEPNAPSFGKDLEEQFNYFKSLNFWVGARLRDCIVEKHLSNGSDEVKHTLMSAKLLTCKG
ncbi:MAG: adenylate/guanylate cyclase domain-containing protein [Acidobacteriota bacterium]|nr:adenylate/guanylate cyclase domain-containing protein [Acidobacteriota bacterium]